LLLAILTGSFAAALAWAAFRRLIVVLILLIPLQIAAQMALTRMVSRVPALSASGADHAKLLHRLKDEGGLAMLMICAGYSLVLGFIQKEGRRVFGSLTEVRLAQEVHQALVPAISRRIGEYEIYGISVPSGQVGGDLVDLVETDSQWTAYVADVAGHGVPAGMVMAMVKSAVRMGTADATSLSSLLSNLDKVLGALSSPNVFVTFACIMGGQGPNLVFSLAGHLPILHYRRREGVIEERSISNLPLAAVPNSEFVTANITCEPGDVLAIVTDGLTETSDEAERELGLEPLKTALLESVDVPLDQVTQFLRNASLQYGKQLDDQTVLLVRRKLSLQ
jgi:sigma-B regulation protein RsbU (phosphoserine phosphatase)